MNPVFITPAQAAKALHVSKSQVYRLMDSGKLPSTRELGPRLIPYQAVLDLALKVMMTKPADPAA
jgi:excisionase family DNA binding protein